MRIFTEQIARKPDHYKWTQKIITAMWDGTWTPNKFTFQSDLQDFKTIMSEQEQQVIVRTLSAIGQIEIAVKTYWARLGNTFPHPSIIDMGLVMANIEVIHNIAYEKLLKVLGLENQFMEILKEPVIEGRVKYLRKYLAKEYTNEHKQAIYALILFTLFVENVSLFSQFYIILWFGRYRNVLKDTNNQVLYTAKEELLHAQAGIKLVNTIRKECPELFDADLEARILHEAGEALIAECKIIDWIIGDYAGERLNKDILKEYVKSRIHDSLKAIGFDTHAFVVDKKYKREFEWMNEEVIGNSSVDFFFKEPTDYSKKEGKAEELF